MNYTNGWLGRPQRVVINAEGVNEEAHCFFAVVLFGSIPPPPFPPADFTLPLLTLSSLCVAGGACLSQLMEEGKKKDPKKTTAKNCGSLPKFSLRYKLGIWDFGIEIHRLDP
jgi:hypothetical protein